MKPFVFSQSTRTPVLLKEIPRSQYSDAPVCKKPLNEKSRKHFFKLLRKKTTKPNIQKATQSTETFNAAAWLSFDLEVTGPFCLLISYVDNDGKHHALIEKTAARGTKSLMLSGEATVKISGELQSLNVELLGLTPKLRCWVDDVHLRRVSDIPPQDVARTA